MKSLSLGIILMLATMNLFGQHDLSEKRQIDFKLYSNFDFSSKYINYGADTINGVSRNEYDKEIKGFNFSPSLVFHTQKGNSSEIEISRLDYSNKYHKNYTSIDSTGKLLNVLSGNHRKEFELYLRYEYKLGLFKNKEWKKMKMILGFSGTPFVVWNKTEPILPTQFTQSETIMGLYLSVITRIEYSINDSWYLDFNIPLALATSHYTTLKNENPALPLKERTTTIIDPYNSPVNFAIRLGVGFRI